MNKGLKSITGALVVAFSLSIVLTSAKIAPFGVDVVSAASEVTGAPTPAKTSTKTPTRTSTKYATSANSSSVIKVGSQGDDVKRLQTSLNKNGSTLNADGIFGDLTLTALKEYQKQKGLVADGIAGAKTLALLDPVEVTASTRTMLILGNSGNDVKTLQTNLNILGSKLITDGIFGNLTKNEVMSFQKINGLVADGIYGMKTYAKLVEKTKVATPVTPAKPVTPVTPTTPVTPPVDVISSASVTDDAAVFEKSIGKDGKWIIAVTKDITLDKELVVNGDFKNGKKNTDGTDAYQRKIALYSQDENRKVTAHFTLTAPQITFNSINGSLEHGTFVGDVYVSGKNFKLVAQKVQGNIYFTNQSAMDTFTKDATSVVTGESKLISTLQIGRVEAAAHGTKCFSVAVVAMTGDKIALASIDDYQFVAKAGFIAVPNSDKDFGKNYPAGQVLISKKTNSAAYSAHMKEAGGATLTWDANMAAVEEFATGKTVAELEAIIKTNTGIDAKVDAVSSATFADTNGYLNAIVAAAKDAKNNSFVKVDATDIASLKIGRVEAAAHGTRCFSVAVSIVAGDKILADSVDDYQFVAPAGFIAVPNSDKDFGKNYPAGMVLVSKRTNTAAYSALMAEEGGATQTWDSNMAGVESFAAGKTITELDAAIRTNAGVDAKVDAVSSATFADTNGYLNAIDAAAKAAK